MGNDARIDRHEPVQDKINRMRAEIKKVQVCRTLSLTWNILEYTCATIKWNYWFETWFELAKIVSEYDQEIKPQTTPWHLEEEPLNHHETSGRQIKQSNQLSFPHQDDYNARMDIK